MTDKSDPTRVPEFQKVLRHFVTTPPRHHKSLSSEHKQAPDAKANSQKKRSKPAKPAGPIEVLEIDLSTLESVLYQRDGLVPHSFQGCIFEVTISPEALAAILAFDLSRIISVIGPLKVGSALSACE